MAVDLDRFEESTVICALIHYSLAVAEPSECIRVLEKVSPYPAKKPWAEIIAEARASYRAIFDAVDPLLGAETANLVGAPSDR